jgi:hypothetical protein
LDSPFSNFFASAPVEGNCETHGSICDDTTTKCKDSNSEADDCHPKLVAHIQSLYSDMDDETKSQAMAALDPSEQKLFGVDRRSLADDTAGVEEAASVAGAQQALDGGTITCECINGHIAPPIYRSGWRFCIPFSRSRWAHLIPDDEPWPCEDEPTSAPTYLPTGDACTMGNECDTTSTSCQLNDAATALAVGKDYYCVCTDPTQVLDASGYSCGNVANPIFAPTPLPVEVTTAPTVFPTKIPPSSCDVAAAENGRMECYNFGDPHFTTFSGVHHNAMGQGEYILAEDSDKAFTVHACHQPVLGSTPSASISEVLLNKRVSGCV